MDKRILFLADDLCSGGAERQMVTVASSLRKRGVDVTVYCYGKADFYADILRDAGVPIIWEYSPNYLQRMIRVRRHIRNGKYDVVISYLPTCNFLNDFAAVGGCSWKVIAGERSAKTSTFLSRKGKLFVRFQKYTDFIVCNSRNAANGWEKYVPEYKDKLKVIYNTVHLGPISSEYVPHKDGKTHILVAATYQFLKNPLGMIDAIMQMSEEQRSNVVIDWYGRQSVGGDSRAYEKSVELVEKYGIHDTLHLNSDTKDIADKMQQADAVMLLSWIEGLPNVICEAMTIGKPIIMSRVSDYDVLVDETNGFLCDWDNPASIKDAIVGLCSLDVEALASMGKASSAKAEKLFSDSSIIDKWEEIINN